MSSSNGINGVYPMNIGDPNAYAGVTSGGAPYLTTYPTTTGVTPQPSTEDQLRKENRELRARIEQLEEHLRRAERELVMKKASELLDIEKSLR